VIRTAEDAPVKITDRRGYIALVVLFLAIAAFAGITYYLTRANRSSTAQTGDGISSSLESQ
jgi:hypothetical protein